MASKLPKMCATGWPKPLTPSATPKLSRLLRPISTVNTCRQAIWNLSGQDPPPEGTLAEPTNPVFNPVSKDGTAIRPYDAEYKILENLATRIPDGSDGSGVSVDLYTEDRPCPACSDVIEQFQARYPKATLNVIYTNPPPN